MLTRLKPVAAVGVGTLLVVVVAAALIVLGDRADRNVHALVLIVPVVVAGLLGGRIPAIAVSAVAAVALAMFLEPIGSPAVYLRTDLVALLVFVLVAVATAVLVGAVVSAERRRLDADRARLDALEQMETQRKALLRSVSHDLRTPLATIRAATGELYDGADYGREGRNELLGLVLGETERLDRIVANLLSLSRIEAGAFLPDRQPTNLDELVTSSAGRLGRVIAEHPTDVVADDDLPLVAVDYSQFDQVVTNLLENAARHSPAGSRIRVELSDVGDAVRLTVADEGEGFEAEHQALLFQPFALATGAGSSGIGLAICRAIVEAHGGSIAAANRSGGGAVVTVTMPSGR